jgi:hypothetical protein
MGSFEWMELQALTGEISASRTRLAAARNKKDHHLVRTLEQEIAAAEKRRAKLLAHITNHIASVPEGASKDVTIDTEPSEGPAASVPRLAEVEVDPSSADVIDISKGGAPSPTAAPQVASVEGGTVVWDQLTPGDIERAKNELESRRAKALARQADELKTLDADEAQLDTLEQAIDAFLGKFPLLAEGAS